MSKPESVLSENKKRALAKQMAPFCDNQAEVMRFIEQVEQATISAIKAQLADKEPVAWDITHKTTGRKHITDIKESADAAMTSEFLTVTPLYAHTTHQPSEAASETESTGNQSSPTSIGDRIRFTRAKLGLSQVALATMCEIAPTQLSRYESGRSVPRVETITKIACVLNVSPESLAIDSSSENSN